MDSSKRLNVLQLNCHKRKETNVEANNWIGLHGHSIALLQEPAQNKGRITSINNKKVRCYTGSKEKPRACILLDRKMRSFLITQFSDRDTVTLLIKDNLTNENIYICSAYMPFDSPDMPPPRIIQELVAHCESKGINLILGTDANAHHTIWGSSDTNNRGENLLEFIASTNLTICNRGNSPTFSNVIRQEVLDLTLCSMNIQWRVHDWKVLNEDMLSDHHPITFVYDLEPHLEP